jgi:hypothetical protein
MIAAPFEVCEKTVALFPFADVQIKIRNQTQVLIWSVYLSS